MGRLAWMAFRTLPSALLLFLWASPALVSETFGQPVDAYLAQTESALQRYYDQMVRLNTRSQGVDPMTRASFQKAKRDFMQKGERARSLLDRMKKMSPQLAQQYKPELDQAFADARVAFEVTVASFPGSGADPGTGVPSPKEARKADYIAQIESAVNNYNRQMVRLVNKTGQTGPLTQSGFQAARRQFNEEVEDLRRLLRTVSALSPEEARVRKTEVDAGLQRVKTAYESAASYVE